LTLPIILLIALTTFSLLSLLGNIFIFLRLFSTESRAPRLSLSLSRLGLKIDESQSVGNTRFDAHVLPLVSVIVSARNEEEKIERCLDSLTSQTYSNLEIVVIDDNSTDRTCEIVREFEKKDMRVRLVHAGPKPEGWVGKSWPCWRGFEESRGEILLFVDADSAFSKITLESCVKYMLAQNYDVLSISPRVSLDGVWSHSIMPFLSGAINLFYPMEKVNDPASKRAYVFGAFILIRRVVYEAIGGHKRVRDRIVEDAAIGENAKSMGYRLRVEVGDGFATTDWEHELGSVFYGLERVMSHSVRSYGLLSSLQGLLFFFIGLYPLLIFLWGISLWATSPAVFSFSSNLILLAFVASVFSVTLILATVAHEMKLVAGKIGPYPLLYPLGCLLFILAIFSTSIKISSRRGLKWKGVEYKQLQVARK
jgi:chlorobactene glucosyltransferase